MSSRYGRSVNAVLAARIVMEERGLGGGNIDPILVDPAVPARTRAILCVHQLGMPCDLARLLPITDRLGLPLIEDAACAAGSEINLGQGWERIGRPHGLAACFSFHPRKVLTTGEGGMITTGDATLAAHLWLLRAHGMSHSAHHRHAAAEVTFERYEVPGFNHRLSDISAAIGRVQLGRLTFQVARQLAELSALTARSSLSAPRDATATGARHRHSPRRDVRPSGASLSSQRLALHRRRRLPLRSVPLCRARTERGGARPLHHHSALSQMTATQDRVVEALSEILRS
jgi:dTDP-4-amino-4,6-dideoxygalactose transaminase